jgi:hypothetical protein
VNEEGAPFDSGFDDAGPFSDTPEGDGVPLDAALREFGPAAFEDLVPRLRALAADLDAAHDAGFIHGRLHPSKVFVTGDATYLIGARVAQSIDASTALGAGPSTSPAAGDGSWPVLPPYTAPEVVEGATPAPAADQFALAAIAYEWMFGRPLSGPAARPLDVRAVPNVDRAALSKAFSRALTPEPFGRFASCTDFVDAVAASLVPSLPLMHVDDEEDPVQPFVPEAKAPPDAATAPVPDLSSFPPEEPNVTAAEPDLDAINPVLHTPAVDPVRGWRAESAEPIAATRADRARFSGLALILATFVGAGFGFAAGYMARPRALQSGPSQEIAPAGADNELKPAAPVPAPGTSATGKAPTPAPKAPKAPEAPTRIGRLLIRSTPSGASVEVDGVARGVTPLALQELDLGGRQITVSRPGYVSEERRIVLTKARPSRSVEVRLSPPEPPKRAPSAAPESGPRPATPASLGKPAVATGTLAIESLPSGASVAINGTPGGTTPVTISDLPPGEYRVTITLQGYRPFATTVRVVAGERARAAARLTEQEQE